MKRIHSAGLDVPTQKEIAGRIAYYETQLAKTKSVDRQRKARNAIARLQRWSTIQPRKAEGR